MKKYETVETLQSGLWEVAGKTLDIFERWIISARLRRINTISQRIPLGQHTLEGDEITERAEHSVQDGTQSIRLHRSGVRYHHGAGGTRTGEPYTKDSTIRIVRDENGLITQIERSRSIDAQSHEQNAEVFPATEAGSAVAPEEAAFLRRVTKDLIIADEVLASSLDS